MNKLPIFIVFSIFISSCTKNETENTFQENTSYVEIEKTFGKNINLNQLENYSKQAIPSYITKFNDQNNPITDKGATLGRVLFYDKQLSSDKTISCASCHQQNLAFSDNDVASTGVNGKTARHAMRLINTRFSNESKFFWDERASSLEMQVTMPIKDHKEMGFSGTDGDSSFSDLIIRMKNIGYYKELFQFVYGSDEITESKIQLALAQFVRSIQSFDSKYDIGRAQVNNDALPFPNFTVQENEGKRIFMTPPVFDNQGIRINGGLGCAGCHAAPEFSIDPNALSNGIGGSINGGSDFTNTKAPSLRDLLKSDGTSNGPMMHTGIITTIQAAIGHYGNLTQEAINNPNLDPRLKPNNFGQQLNLTASEVNAVIAFIKTLTGTDVYNNPKWSNPFLL